MEVVLMSFLPEKAMYYCLEFVNWRKQSEDHILMSYILSLHLNIDPDLCLETKAIDITMTVLSDNCIVATLIQVFSKSNNDIVRLYDQP